MSFVHVLRFCGGWYRVLPIQKTIADDDDDNDRALRCVNQKIFDLYEKDFHSYVTHVDPNDKHLNTINNYIRAHSSCTK